MGFFTKPVTAAAAFQRATARPYGAPRSITASARLYAPTSKTSKPPRGYREWQKDAWKAYDKIGEIHFGFNLLADTFSRVRVFAAAVSDSAETPVSVNSVSGDTISSELARDAAQVMLDLASEDFSSQARTFALNMAVAGECLLLQLPDASTAGEGRGGAWVIRSTDEVTVTKDTITLKGSATSSSDTEMLWKKGMPDINIGRIWQQHPRFTDEPDSSMAAIAEPVDELLLLSRLIRTVSRAKLNAGILFLPDGVTIMGGTEAPLDQIVDASGQTQDAAMDDSNVVLQELMDSMVAAIEDEDSPSAVVPMLLSGPGEQGQHIRHIMLDRKTDEWLTSRADRALERIMQGIAIPKDLVTGLANVKYSNGIIIDNNFWKSSVEPLALTFSDALTDIYLRPRLRAMGHSEEDVKRLCVWYDPSEIVTTPDQSDDASKGYENHLLSGEAWRRIHGFAETDAPDEKELAIQLLLAKGQLKEDVVAALLQVALPNVLKGARDNNAEGRVPESADNILFPNEDEPTEESVQ